MNPVPLTLVRPPATAPAGPTPARRCAPWSAGFEWESVHVPAHWDPDADFEDDPDEEDGEEDAPGFAACGLPRMQCGPPTRPALAAPG
jgi:hypothetical protein